MYLKKSISTLVPTYKMALKSIKPPLAHGVRQLFPLPPGIALSALVSSSTAFSTDWLDGAQFLDSFSHPTLYIPGQLGQSGAQNRLCPTLIMSAVYFQASHSRLNPQSVQAQLGFG